MDFVRPKLAFGGGLGAGGPQIFSPLESYYFCDLGAHASNAAMRKGEELERNYVPVRRYTFECNLYQSVYEINLKLI